MGYNFTENIQRGILYLFKSDEDFHCQIAPLVKPEYFEFPSHQIIFSSIQSYFSDYRKLPHDEILLVLCSEAKSERDSLSEYEDELELINRLDSKIYDNPEFYLDAVEEFAKKEAFKKAIRECVALSQSDEIDACEEVIRKALTVSRNVDLGQDYFSSVSERWSRQNEQKHELKFPTVFNGHNDNLEGGLNAKELAMVVAPPGVGKSLYLVNQAVRCLTERKKVLYITLEMAEDKIARRIDSVAAQLDNRSLQDPTRQLELHKRLKMFQEKYEGSQLVIKEFPTGLATVNTIRSFLVQLKNYSGFSPDVIIVDYLELLRPCYKMDAEYMAQQKIAEELRGLGVENKCLMWTATQTNRKGKQVAIIDDTELGDSYGKIRVCDWAISLNQTQEEYDSGCMRVFVMKARDAKQKYTIPTSVNYSTLEMKDKDTEYDLEQEIEEQLRRT